MRPFKPASPAKRATAPQAGELSGTISARYPYILVRYAQSVTPAAAALSRSDIFCIYCILYIFWVACLTASFRAIPEAYAHFGRESEAKAAPASDNL